MRRVTQSVGSPVRIIVPFIRMKRGRVLDSTLGTWVEPAFGDPSPAALPLPLVQVCPPALLWRRQGPSITRYLTRHP